MEGAAKRKLITTNTNSNLFVDIATNTNYTKPMMLNAWTQTKSEDFVVTGKNNLIQQMQDRIKKLEEMFKAQNISIDEPEFNQSINGPIGFKNAEQNELIEKSTLKTMQPENSLYEIISVPADFIMAPDDVKYAEKNDLNTNKDLNLIEICFSKEDYLVDSEQYQNIKQFDKNQSQENVLRYASIDHNTTTIDDGKVSFGPNKTRISAAIYKGIDWRSFKIATRKLLLSIFDRETLATHTMTGKPSPAFRERDLAAKHQLNPRIVQDIIFAVSSNCNVPEKEVRAVITTKCADENKMLKQREKRIKSLQKVDKKKLMKGGEIN